jgi:hypothetical protein
MSLLLVMLALCMLYVYRDISDPQGSLHAGTKSARVRTRWHAFMTRHAARP